MDKRTGQTVCQWILGTGGASYTGPNHSVNAAARLSSPS
jgi:hypothetical protein